MDHVLQGVIKGKQKEKIYLLDEALGSCYDLYIVH